MAELYYRTGPAARILNVSPHTIRRLVETGLIAAEASLGGHFRIPRSEIVRLQKEGIPPIPAPPDDEGVSVSEQPKPEAGSLQVIDAGPRQSNAVRESFDQVAITRNQLDKRKIEREREEVEDWFRGRDEFQQSNQKSVERATRDQQAQARAREERTALENAWVYYAINSLPHDAPVDMRLQIPALVRELWKGIDQHLDIKVVQRLVDAVIEKSLGPWRRSLVVDEIVKKAVQTLPGWARGMSTPTIWETRAAQAARVEIRQLDEDASQGEIETVAREAVRPIMEEFECLELCKSIASATWVSGATSDERDEAKRMVLDILRELPIGTHRRKLEEARNHALMPLVQRIAQREDQETRDRIIRKISWPWGFPEEERPAVVKAVCNAFDQLPVGTNETALKAARDRALHPFLEAHASREKKIKLIDRGLEEIFSYLLKLDLGPLKKGPWTLTDEFKPSIRERLEPQLTGDEPIEDVAKLVRRLVDRKLGRKNSIDEHSRR